MKKLFIIAIIGIAILFQNCGPKEKQEKTDILNDTIVPELVIIDTITEEEVILEDLSEEPIKTSTHKSTTVTKVTVKDPVKVVTKTTTETKVGEITKVEVVVVEPPTKTTETPPVVKVIVQEPKPAPNNTSWTVPAKYLSMKNPTEASASNIADGKVLYDKHCKSCHGKAGLGDGTKAAEVDGDLGDFSSKEFQAQTDGALFFKSYFGRDDMPNYEKKIPDQDDIWYIVSYVRTLKK